MGVGLKPSSFIKKLDLHGEPKRKFCILVSELGVRASPLNFWKLVVECCQNQLLTSKFGAEALTPRIRQKAGLTLFFGV